MALVITVNGAQHTVRARPDTPLLYVLRNELHLHGPHFGCGLAQCGACAVLLGRRQIRSCVTPVAGVVGQSITTLEGLPALYARTQGKNATALALHPQERHCHTRTPPGLWQPVFRHCEGHSGLPHTIGSLKTALAAAADAAVSTPPSALSADAGVSEDPDAGSSAWAHSHGSKTHVPDGDATRAARRDQARAELELCDLQARAAQAERELGRARLAEFSGQVAEIDRYLAEQRQSFLHAQGDLARP
jgi:hypothetical protein